MKRRTVFIGAALAMVWLGAGACDDGGGGGGNGGSGNASGQCACDQCVAANCLDVLQGMCGPGSTESECIGGACGAWSQCINSCYEQSCACTVGECGDLVCADTACVAGCQASCQANFTPACQQAGLSFGSCAMTNCQAECQDGAGGSGAVGAGGSGGGPSAECLSLLSCCLQITDPTQQQACVSTVSAGDGAACQLAHQGYLDAGACSA